MWCYYYLKYKPLYFRPSDFSFQLRYMCVKICVAFTLPPQFDFQPNNDKNNVYMYSNKRKKNDDDSCDMIWCVHCTCKLLVETHSQFYVSFFQNPNDKHIVITESCMLLNRSRVIIFIASSVNQDGVCSFHSALFSFCAAHIHQIKGKRTKKKNFEGGTN